MTAAKTIRVVLDIETLHAVDWEAIRSGRGFVPASDRAWEEVLPAQVAAVRLELDPETGVESVVDKMNTTVHWADARPLDNPYCPHLTLESVRAGVSPKVMFQRLAELSRGVTAFVGYNVAFDTGCLRHHAAALGRPLPDAPDLCLMGPSADRMGQRRWPKLVDAYRALVGEPDESRAHDAAYDVHMTRELLTALKL